MEEEDEEEQERKRELELEREREVQRELELEQERERQRQRAEDSDIQSLRSLKRQPASTSFDVTSQSSDFVVSRNTSGTATPSTGHYNLELSKNRRKIKNELTRLSNNFNLLIFMVFGIFSLSWYIIGIQWLPDPRLVPKIDCNIKQLAEVNWTYDEKLKIINPDNGIYPPGCAYNNYDYSKLSNMSYKAALKNISNMEHKPKYSKCDNYTIVSDIPQILTHSREFEIFCYKTVLQQGKHYVHFGVSLFGFPTGLIADMYGRRPVCIVCSIVLFLTTAAITISQNFVVYALGKLILGGSLYAVNMMLAIIYAEIHRSKLRVMGNLFAFAWFYIGSTHPSTVFYLVEVWRLRKLLVLLATLIIIYGAIIITPESPRLLMTKKQFKTAWKWMHELGSSKLNPNLEDYPATQPTLAYQLKILTRPYLLHRIYIVLLLNGVATIFYYVFNYLKRSSLKNNDRLKVEMTAIQVLLMVMTSILTLWYTRKTMLCVFYILLALCILTNMISHEITTDVSALTGRVFAAVAYILSYIYLIEIFPTTHRASSMGFYLTINHFMQGWLEMYIQELVVYKNPQFLSAFYCGICLISALIAIMAPESDFEIPDKKDDLFVRLVIDQEAARNSNR